MQVKSERVPNDARSAETTERLIAVAREMFAEHGYAATSTPAIVKAAGVTRGALYHHFSDKADLFKAVVLRESKSVAALIGDQTTEFTSAAEALRAGSFAYFDAMAAPGRAKLLLVEGPAILGTDTISQIDEDTGRHELRLGLELAVKLGELDPVATGALSDILSAAFDRAALAIVSGAKRSDYADAIDVLLSNLLKS